MSKSSSSYSLDPVEICPICDGSSRLVEVKRGSHVFRCVEPTYRQIFRVDVGTPRQPRPNRPRD